LQEVPRSLYVGIYPPPPFFRLGKKYEKGKRKRWQMLKKKEERVRKRKKMGHKRLK
jgi:hypothetical protein